MQIVFDFIQQQLLGMQWLAVVVSKLLIAIGIDPTERVGGTLQFFIYDSVKIVLLLCILIFVISYIQSYFPPERSKKIMSRFNGTLALVVQREEKIQNFQSEKYYEIEGDFQKDGISFKALWKPKEELLNEQDRIKD